MKRIKLLCLFLGIFSGILVSMNSRVDAEEWREQLSAVEAQLEKATPSEVAFCEYQLNEGLLGQHKQGQKKDPCAPCLTGRFVSQCDVTITCHNSPGRSLSYGNLSCSVECQVGNRLSSVPSPDCNVLCEKTCGGRRRDCTCKVVQYF